MAENYIKQNDYVKAREVLEDLITRDALSDPEAYVMLATCQLNLGEKEKAIETSEQGAKYFPRSDRLAQFYISLLLATTDKSTLVTRLRDQLARHPNSPVYIKGLGQALLNETPSSSETEKLLVRASEMSPADPEAHYLYGKWACLNSKEELCIAELTKVVNLSPTNELAKMQSFTLIGLAEDKLERVINAESAFKKSLESNRSLSKPNSLAAFEYVNFLIKHSRSREAQPLINEILRWTPDFGPAHFERAKFLAQQQGGKEQAVKEGEEALLYLGADKEKARAVHAFLAKTYYALGLEDRAKAHQNWIVSNQQ